MGDEERASERRSDKPLGEAWLQAGPLGMRGGGHEKLWELARRHNLESPGQLLEKLLAGGIALPGAGGAALPADCTARRGRRGGEPLNVYYVECRDGARAIVPGEALADLAARFKLSIKVVE